MTVDVDVDVRIVYFEGCPHVDTARARVVAAIGDRTDVEVRLQRVDDAAGAIAAGMHGSPTILVDGVDPFAPIDAEASWSCRVYPPEIGSDGAPSVDQLRRALG